MSSTTRGNKVENDDFFATPPWVVNAILPELPATGAVLDPCCGEGAILDVVQHGRPTLGIEINAERAATARVIHTVAHGDALKLPWPNAPVSIYNPPFSLAEEFVRKGIEHVFKDLPDEPLLRRGEERTRACAVLLRLAFLESAERAVLHREHPCDVYPLSHRPSFAACVSCAAQPKSCGWKVTLPLRAPRPATCDRCGAKTKTNTTDSCAYAWFVWGPGRGGRIKVLDAAPTNVRKYTSRSIDPAHIESVAAMAVSP